MPEKWQAAAKGKSVSQEELKEVARELLSAAGNINVWLLFGEMGSGKTTLIKAIAQEAGVSEGMSSPTFSIVNEYKAGESGRRIFHFDFYRLGTEKEIFETGAVEYFDSDELCLVEWPEKLGSLTPHTTFRIRITPTGTHHRKIEYQRP